MKVLYVAHKPPVPNVDGGTFAMKQFADALVHEVSADAFVLATHKHPFTDETKNYLQQKFQSFAYEHIATQIKFLPFLWSLLSGSSYILKRFKSRKLKEFLLENDYGLIVCDSLFSLHAVLEANPEIRSKLWLRSHNAEFMNWITLSDQQGFLKRILYRIQAKQLRKKELELVKKAALNFCISDSDEKLFNTLLPEARTMLLPIHVETHAVEINRHPQCFFIGSPNWGPNIDTVNYLLKCWKNETFRKHQLTIAGGFDHTYSDDKVPPGVKLLGRVDNVSGFMAENGILVAPSFSGSGIKVKVLEALGNGIPVITTVSGAQGITEDAGLIVIANEEELLNAISRLKSDRGYFDSVSANGKAYIQKKHSFAVVKAILKEAFGE